ncbi:hypothetical protein M0R45_000225 [Rubus argutus]|uniref:No apical meristem-associated C-terminal domain-containing protein n=1 Tax=Rubus argutus TaxID=59490 RepID=A0AAW1VPX5_RUBAR
MNDSEKVPRGKAFSVKRNHGGLRSRFKVMKANCTKYASRVAETKRLRISGFTEADIMKQANISFKQKEKVVFGYHHCWRYLKDANTWNIPVGTNNDSDNFIPRSSNPLESSEFDTSKDYHVDPNP